MFPKAIHAVVMWLPPGRHRYRQIDGCHAGEQVHLRVRINWEGERPGDVFLYAACVSKDGGDLSTEDRHCQQEGG